MYKKFNKKSQIAGQVFIFILVALMIGMVVLIGSRLVLDIHRTTCMVGQVSFKNDLKDIIKDNNDYGAFHKESLSVPCSYETLCFVSADRIGQDIQCSNSIIRYIVKTGEKSNIFISSRGSTVPIGYSEYVSVDQDCVCIKSRNNYYPVSFEGKGSKTIISETQ